MHIETRRAPNAGSDHPSSSYDISHNFHRHVQITHPKEGPCVYDRPTRVHNLELQDQLDPGNSSNTYENLYQSRQQVLRYCYECLVPLKFEEYSLTAVTATKISYAGGKPSPSDILPGKYSSSTSSSIFNFDVELSGLPASPCNNLLK